MYPKNYHETPFDHNYHFGTVFRSETCDFKNAILVYDKPQNEILFARDVAEMIAFHAFNIHPELNGFQGYDCINFAIVS